MYALTWRLIPKLREEWECRIGTSGRRWPEVYRAERKFLDKFNNWLNKFIISADKSVLESSPESTSAASCGRPSVSFSEASERTKRRETVQIRKEKRSEETAYATQMSLRAEGESDAAHVLQDITFGSPSKTFRYRKSLKFVQERRLFDDETLSLII